MQKHKNVKMKLTVVSDKNQWIIDDFTFSLRLSYLL